MRRSRKMYRKGVSISNRPIDEYGHLRAAGMWVSILFLYSMLANRPSRFGEMNTWTISITSVFRPLRSMGALI